MSFVEELAAAMEQLRGTCVVAAALRDWPEAADLAAALTDATVPPAAIAAASSGRDPRLGTQAVAEHRAGSCPCVIPAAEPVTESTGGA